MEGFERGRNLDKIGLHAQDTAELFFDNVVVPKENLLGEEGSGFVYLMKNLPQERLSIAMMAAAACEAVLDMCLAYAKEREAFGRPIGKFQHTRFMLAEMATEAHIARVFVDDCVRRHNAGELDAKLRVDGEVVDHRAAEEDRRPGRAAVRRLRLHDASTRSRRRSWTAGCRRSTAARPRSRRRSSAGPSASDADRRRLRSRQCRAASASACRRTGSDSRP